MAEACDRSSGVQPAVTVRSRKAGVISRLRDRLLRRKRSPYGTGRRVKRILGLEAWRWELLKSLEGLTGTEIRFLLSFLEWKQDETEDLFLLPYDQHPSPLGADRYAEAMARLMRSVFAGGGGGENK